MSYDARASGPADGGRDTWLEQTSQVDLLVWFGREEGMNPFYVDVTIHRVTSSGL